MRVESLIGGIVLVDALAAIAPEIEHRQVDQLAELQPPVDLPPVPRHRRARDPHRHPLVVRPLGRAHPLGVRPLPRLVLVRSMCPAAVGDLVVVPRGDERHRSVQRLEVAVGLVLRVPAAVVAQADDLARRVVPAHVLVAVAVRVLAGLVLIQVVAEVDHGVEVSPLGEVPVRVEPARLPVGARHDPEPQPLRRAARRGCRPRSPRARHGVDVGEAEPVVRRRRQPGRVELDRVVAPGVGVDRAGAHDVRECVVEGDLPAHRGARPVARPRHRLLGRSHPGPQHHGVRERITRGDSMAERRHRRRRCGRRQDLRPQDAQPGSKSEAADQELPTIREQSSSPRRHTPIRTGATEPTLQWRVNVTRRSDVRLVPNLRQSQSRDDRIRTCDPPLPKRMRYQAALHPVAASV